ncbi:unnamed protein product [Effrenium voratum]|uniref:Uncharacterized protein n=1 Tax=Effrenium voratum TaxID=2562239 RepID=A0AA36IU15_9DINO|nr:unnamed protein product [Effrenium voratum]
MGVPMLRPTSPSAVSVLVPNPAWLDIFRSCSIRDLGASLAVDKHWRTVVDSPYVWADAYDRTQRVDDSSSPIREGTLRSLIDRPFGEDAIGWHVAVLAEDSTDGAERYFTGHVVAFSAETDTYLVAYGNETQQPTMVWEQERRKRTAAMRHNPSLAGKSRFNFLSPPPQLWSGSSSSTASPGSTEKVARRSERSWKEELKHNVLEAPTRLLTTLKAHSDEVLFVVFSPCGTRLASCARDLQTIIFKVCYDSEAGSEDDESMQDHAQTSQRGRRRSRSTSHGYPRFEQEAVCPHQTAPVRAMWWPIPPYEMLAVSTEDAGLGWQASKVEIWKIGPSPDEGHQDSDGSESRRDLEECPPGFNAHCLFQCHNRPFDIYATIFEWPPMAPSSDDPEEPYKRLCFLAGWAVLRENEHYVQWLNVWPGPYHPSFHKAALPGANGTQKPLARLRLEGEMNYLHCMEVGPADAMGRQQVLAMTGSTPHLCNEIGLMDLSGLQRRGEGPEGAEGEASALPKVYDVGVKVHSLGERVVLSAKWNEAGNFILLNTRPYAHAASRKCEPQTASFEDVLLRAVPDLSTKMELLLLDASSLDIVSVFDGHFAFTTKESPFLIFTDEWANSDFLASGGEDHRVYVWHRRHKRLVRRLCGHTEPVNAVSWNGKGLLASSSDDNSVIIWAAAGARMG